MKILMTTDAVGGLWTYSMELASALAKHNVHIVLATMGPALTADQSAEAAALPNVTVHTSTHRLEWMAHPWEDVNRAGEWLLDIERTEHPDIIHLNHFAFGPLPWLAPVVMVAHGCACSWWHSVRRSAIPPELNHYRDVVRRGLGAADMVIATTSALVDAMRPHYLRFPHVRVIYNARTAAPFRSEIPPEARARVVFSAGRLWDEGMNLQALRTAAGTLEWPVRVAGPLTGPDGSTAVTGDLNALGFLPPAEIARELKSAAVYALPALYEPFGLSALEAALSGCALVLSDIPTLREVWKNAAVFVQPTDAQSLHTAIDTLMRDEGLRTCLADRACQRALLFKPSVMAASYMDAYAAVAPTRALLV